MAAIRGALIVAVACAIACGQSAPRRDQIERRIVEAGAVVVGTPDIHQTSSGESASWELQVSAGWTAYREAVAKAFAGQFEVVRDDDEVLVLSRVASGDSYRLEFRAAGAANHVRAVFTAFPD